jgi:hypothetical protein
LKKIEKKCEQHESVASAIFNFFVAMDSFKKDNVHQQEFILENLGLLVLENHLPI